MYAEQIPEAITEGGSVRIPYTAAKHVVQPLELRGRVYYVFDPGAVLESEPDSYQADDCMLSANQASVNIGADGATFRVATADQPSEHRHALSLLGCTYANVHGGTFSTNSGDGCYLGPHVGIQRLPCRNITVKGATFQHCYRQGISITSAVGVRIDDCIIRRTAGTSPQAAIDIEPNHPQDWAQGISINDFTAIQNQGSGLVVNIAKLNATSQPVGVKLQRANIYGCDQPPLRIIMTDPPPAQIVGAGVRGLIHLEDVECLESRYAGFYARLNLDSDLDIVLRNVTWRKTANLSTQSPVMIDVYGAGNTRMVLDGCTIIDHIANRPPVLVNAMFKGLRGVVKYKGDWLGEIPNAPNLTIEAMPWF